MAEIDRLRTIEKVIESKYVVLPAVASWTVAPAVGLARPELAPVTNLVAFGGFSVNLILLAVDMGIRRRISEIEAKRLRNKR